MEKLRIVVDFIVKQASRKSQIDYTYIMISKLN